MYYSHQAQPPPQRRSRLTAILVTIVAVEVVGLAAAVPYVLGNQAQPSVIVSAPVVPPTRTSSSPSPAPSPAPPPSTPSPTPEPEPPSTPAPAPEPDDEWPGLMPDAEIHMVAADAIAGVDAYWTDLLSGWAEPAVWHSPIAWSSDGLYDSTNNDYGPRRACGATADEMVFGAQFCGNPVGDSGTVSWDMEFFRWATSETGEAAIWLTVAHEYAHAAQHRFEHEGQDPAVLTGGDRRELQADCIAGATLADPDIVTLDDAELAELDGVLAKIGDERPGEGHGTSAQRIANFHIGFDSGDIESCLGNRS